MKRIDKWIIALVTFVCGTAWLNYAFGQIDVAAYIAALLGVLAAVLTALIEGRYKRLKLISTSAMVTAFATSGENGEHFARLFPASAEAVASGNFVTYSENGVKKLLFVNFKFGDTSLEDIAKCYRYAKANDIKEVTIYAKNTPRAAMLYGSSLPINLSYKDGAAVRRMLAPKNALPEPIKPDRRKIAFNRKEAFSAIFAKRRAKYYAFTALTLLICGVFTPFKLYYAILATVAATAAAVSALFGGAGAGGG